ncbi:MAG TPA: OmpA family protein [Lapillicoccus sp.]|uniref:OmpA family protein n=1 Tax=Lapillicoccus sp. TaxID=1909287 RepID=UPI002F91F770
MSDASAVLDGLLDSLARGDREAALGCFAPGATVVVSGSHHDYSSYPPAVVVDALIRSFMELSWTPSSSRIIGGARVQDGVLTATHIGPFLGTQPSARRVRTSVRMTTALTDDHQLEMLTLWGSRDLLAEELVRPDSDPDGWRFTSGPGPSSDATGEAAPEPGEHVPGETAPARRRDSVHAVRTARILRWSGVAIAVVILVVVIGQGARSIFSSADVVAGTIALRLTPPGNSAGLPVVVQQSAQDAVADIVGGPAPILAAGAGRAPRVLDPVGPAIPFPSDSADLSPSSTAQVDAVAAALVARNLTGAVFIHGFAEDTGSAQRNTVVSTERAAAVATALRDRLAGRPVQLVFAGLGAADPLAAQSSDGQTAVNRRVLVLYPAVR